MGIIAIGVTATLLALAVFVYYTFLAKNRPSPKLLRPGQRLPEFVAHDEDGNTVNSLDLDGSAAVLLFVRGNWCPFCSAQVANLSAHYKDIVNQPARLILVTPKPLETTRRVASFFEFEFEYWLDDGLDAARALGLLHASGVPADHHGEYGEDTLWPMALVIDSSGTIRYAEQSKMLADRPDSKTLLKELKKALNS